MCDVALLYNTCVHCFHHDTLFYDLPLYSMLCHAMLWLLFVVMYCYVVLYNGILRYNNIS